MQQLIRKENIRIKIIGDSIAADGVGDGLHPSNFAQKLIFENIVSELGI